MAQDHSPYDGWCGETRRHEHGLSEGIIKYTDGYAADGSPIGNPRYIAHAEDHTVTSGFIAVGVAPDRRNVRLAIIADHELIRADERRAFVQWLDDLAASMRQAWAIEDEPIG
jgi:hypothetical protein